MAKPNSSGLVAYVNARLLDPVTGLDAKGALLTNGETIADVGPGLFQGGVPSGIEVIDCAGQCLAPGLVDMRVQLREPGEEHKETLKSAGEAAVAGGVTSMVCLPNTDPIIDEVATVEFVARRARKNGLAKVYPYAAATKKLEGRELSEMGFLQEAGALAFTDGIKAIADTQIMRRALSYAANFGALIVQHPEDPSLAGSGVMNAGEQATRMGLSGIPPEAEVIMLERDMRLVAMTGGRYHAAHVSTAEGIEVIRKAKARGLSVTCDTAPPYFCLNELEVNNYRTFAKLSPPLRGEADRRAVIEGLRDGTIDAVASDHAPQDEDAKRQTFTAAEFGGIGLETLLAATLSLVHGDQMSMLDALALLTSKPAGVLGLAAGRLKVGAAADLVVFNPSRGWQVDPSTFKSKSKNSPFDGRPLQGVVLRTVVDGRSVYCA
ncbi:dihydroorotase [Magnetospirillum sp. 64-120]|uniref:dihydroorotase n=1 Tax=Magnetospirillum sp. 64-120 TaxID=1895778 RepID=UPI00092BC85E|nr:dihydroorotase [Magnetospirillum sp. 64-120]OJX79500.1 MAG: dihydroorotase [Magnetospirillum sp. 64-120]